MGPELKTGVAGPAVRGRQYCMTGQILILIAIFISAMGPEFKTGVAGPAV
jgi:hypothetical protein